MLTKTAVDIAAELAKLNQMVDQKLDGFQGILYWGRCSVPTIPVEQVRQEISGVNQRLDGFQGILYWGRCSVPTTPVEQVRQDISGVNQRLDQMDRKMDGLRSMFSGFFASRFNGSVEQLKEDMCDVVAALKPVKGAKDTEAYKWLAQRYPSKEDYKEWISEKIEQQNQKIDQQNQAINQKIDQQNQAINQKMDQQNQKVDQMMRNMQEIFQRLQSTVA